MASDSLSVFRCARRFLACCAFACLLVLPAGPVVAGPRDPIEGDNFRALVAAQDLPLQEFLREHLSERDGFHVLGPVDPLWPGEMSNLSLVRVVCDDLATLESLESAFADTEELQLTRGQGDRGRIFNARVDGTERMFIAVTAQQARWLIWVRDAGNAIAPDLLPVGFNEYAKAVSEYLDRIDRGEDPGDLPDAKSFDLSETVAFYPPRPDYVIEGYANYKSFLYGNEEVKTEFARGIVAFIPTDSLLEAWKANPTEAAFPNKEEPLIQYEFKKFYERGGNYGVIRTLTPEVLRGLEAGEYFFAVGMSGRIRFGFETPREEIDRIEKETGQKVPRANHAYLFPGEAILTAGAFFVERGDSARIVAVNAQSGHYFYSNVTPTVREDIALRSNDFLMTLGHFFRALDAAGIEYDRMLISKL